MNSSPQTIAQAFNPPSFPGKLPTSVDGYDVRIHQKTIWLSGNVRTQSEADELIATINALKAMLPNPSPPALPAPAVGEGDDNPQLRDLGRTEF